MTEKRAVSVATRELDQLFQDILKTLNQAVIETASEAAEGVLKISGDFLSEQARSALERFHTLYVGSDQLDRQKAQINKHVDDLFDSIQSQVATSPGDAKVEIADDEKMKKARLGFSGIQKELETIIRLEEGIRAKLLPALTTMQFEEMIRHRLNNIEKAWDAIIRDFGNSNTLDTAALKDEIYGFLTSNSERVLYYKHILRKDPPKELQESDAQILF